LAFVLVLGSMGGQTAPVPANHGGVPERYRELGSVCALRYVETKLPLGTLELHTTELVLQSQLPPRRIVCPTFAESAEFGEAVPPSS